MNNDEIKAMLENVKQESHIYFEKMDNSFINEIANKTHGDKWKVFSKILTNKMGHEKQAGIQVILDYLKQPDVSSTSPQTETVMKQKPLLRK
jgi:hypothetical protein